ncbi:MAG TPA: hypothetical protein VJI96_00505 [Candidatus Andersenbacteria bacterium]|nr:hypothetical protein [Candidatus Andersenbacteria bacterium]
MQKEKIIEMPPIDEGKYRGEWLALDPETREIVAHGAILKDVMTEAESSGCNDPILHGVPSSDFHSITIEY